MARLLLYNIHGEKLEKIRTAAALLGITSIMVPEDAHAHPVGYLLGYEGFAPSDAAESFASEMLVMEALPGAEFSIDLVADHGEILYMAARQSNSITASIPMESTLFHDEEGYQIARNVIKLLRLDGNADLDFKYDKNGRPVLMEINPRLAATMRIFKEGGMNLPYLRVKQLLGEQLPDCTITTGVKMKRRYAEMFSLIQG